jgi:carboxyl-terminal processing protease
MTVTIARYLTPSGRDINKHGIEPDVQVKMSEQEAQRLKLEDIGTRRDSQYRVAETTLVKKLQSASTPGRGYRPGSANLPSALPRADATMPR